MSRSTANIAIVQALIVFLGFFAVGVVLKGSGYPNAPTPVRWNPLAVALREHGFWLMLAPLFWTFFAVVSERFERGILSSRVAFLAGLVISGIVIALFLYAAFFPYTRPLLIRISASGRSANIFSEA